MPYTVAWYSFVPTQRAGTRKISHRLSLSKLGSSKSNSNPIPTPPELNLSKLNQTKIGFDKLSHQKQKQREKPHWSNSWGFLFLQLGFNDQSERCIRQIFLVPRPRLGMPTSQALLDKETGAELFKQACPSGDWEREKGSFNPVEHRWSP